MSIPPIYLILNQQVGGSSPPVGSILSCFIINSYETRIEAGRATKSGMVMDQSTVTPVESWSDQCSIRGASNTKVSPIPPGTQIPESRPQPGPSEPL